jgi:hypothetical protein
MKEGSRNGAPLFGGTPCGGTAGTALVLGILKVMLSKALEWASISIEPPLLGNMEGRSFLRAFEIKKYLKRFVKMHSKRVYLPIGAPLGNLEGRSFLRAFEIKRSLKRVVKMHNKRVYLPIGAPLGNLEGIRLPERLERTGWCIWVPFLDQEDIRF